MKRLVLSICIMILLSLCSIGVCAKEPPTNPTVPIDEEIVYDWCEGLVIADGVLIKAATSAPELRIPDGVSVISAEAFDKCKARRIFIPASVCTFEGNPFENLNSNVEIYYAGSVTSFEGFDVDKMNLITTAETRKLLRIVFILAAPTGLFLIAISILNWHKKMLIKIEVEEDEDCDNQE